MSVGAIKTDKFVRKHWLALSKTRQGLRLVVVFLEQLHEIGDDQQIVKPFGRTAQSKRPAAVP